MLIRAAKGLAKLNKRRLLGRLVIAAAPAVRARSIASCMGIEDAFGARCARNSILPAGPRSGEGVNPVIPKPRARRSRRDFQDAAVSKWIAHHATTSHLGAARFELGLDKGDDPAAVI